jgi:AcrR family transcriptional regulator
MKSIDGPTVGRTAGRPRDVRIDSAVLHATTELLEEVGYGRLTIAAVAARAGTSPPTVYRRWPTKAHLVHEAVFPSTPDDVLPKAVSLRDGIRAMVISGIQLLGQPAARAAVPGLLTELSAAPELHADLLLRFSGSEWGWLSDRMAQAIECGEVRPDVEPRTVIDLISGSAFLASTIGPPDRINDLWVDQVVDLIMRGITPDSNGH